MTEPATIVLSVDPGKDAAWTHWIDGKPVNWGLLDGDDVWSMVRLLVGISPVVPNIPKIMRGVKTPMKATLVIEDQWLGENYHNAKVITERRMRWQVLAEMFGWGVALVAPTSWQSKLLKGTPGCTELVEKKVAIKINGKVIKKDGKIQKEVKLTEQFNTKKASLLVASQIIGKTISSHDLADSICIGQFWINRTASFLPMDLPLKRKKTSKKRSNHVRK